MHNSSIRPVPSTFFRFPLYTNHGRDRFAAAPREMTPMIRIMTLLTALCALVCLAGQATAAEPLKLLFLGDNGHHQPAVRFKQLQPVLKERGIELTYSDKVEDLNADT